MGREERQRSEHDRIALKNEMGELLPFNFHRFCPGCGARQFTPRYCTGIDLASPNGDTSPLIGLADCQSAGKHLHLACPCGRMWTTRVFNDPDNRASAASESSASMLELGALAAVLLAAGPVEVPKAELFDEARTAVPMSAPTEDGKVRFFLQ